MTLKVGDKVKIARARFAKAYIGYEAEVAHVGAQDARLKPLSPRPLGHQGEFFWPLHSLEKIEEPPRPLGLQAGDKVVNLKTGREGLVLKGPMSGKLKVYDQKPPIKTAVPAQALEEYEFHFPGTYDVWRRVVSPGTRPW